MKTAINVLLDLRALLEGSLFAQSLNGGLYFEETRPKNSKKEDLVLVFTQGFSHQVERGTVTILAYVADIPTDGGNTIPHLKRIKEVEEQAVTWINGLRGGKSGSYLFQLAQTISHYPQSEIKQHFVSIKLDYKYFDGTY